MDLVISHRSVNFTFTSLFFDEALVRRHGVECRFENRAGEWFAVPRTEADEKHFRKSFMDRERNISGPGHISFQTGVKAGDLGLIVFCNGAFMTAVIAAPTAVEHGVNADLSLANFPDDCA